MDQEVYRIVLVLVLTGIVLFSWQYYRGVFRAKHVDPVKVSHQVEKKETHKISIRRDLSKYENCGSLKIVVFPIYKALEFLYERTRNLGIALIFLTLAFRTLLAPLMLKQFHVSKKMATLRGEIRIINRRYGENPLEMQKAIKKLFKKNGVSPLVNLGLFFFQIPLFIVLYKIVREAHIFSGASLGLWIQDLGVPDPYFVLPLIAGFVMFLGNKFLGTDYTRMPKWLTYVLPIMLAGFLLNQPAGLALYILVGSVFQLGMNIVTYKFSCAAV